MAESNHNHPDAHVPSDTVTVLGKTITVPGGIYTVVFGFLAIATLFEIIFAEMGLGALGIILLFTIAGVKSVLVVMYYMHLREDSFVFTIALMFPFLMALAAVLYLVAVPPTGYAIPLP
jgi:cytochrome c oxidase subunit 4